MKDKILRFARGDFGEIQSNIVLSESHIEINAEQGRTYEGSLYIGNEGGLPMKGLLYSECPDLSLSDKVFSGKEVEIKYTFLATGVQVGETVEGNIVIVSNCGEVSVPVRVSVGKPSIGSNAGRIGDFTGFTALAKDNYDEALKIFTDKDFPEIILYRDNEKKLIYEALVRECDPRVALEEFLVATRRKTRVMFDIDRNNINYDNCYAPFGDEVVLKASTWGGVRVDVWSDSAFIKLKKYTVWTSDFPGGIIKVRFEVDAGRMIDGNNTGRINIVTPNQKIEVRINAGKHEMNIRTDIYDRRLLARGLREYIEFRKGGMVEAQFVEKLEQLLDKYRKKCSEELVNILRMYIAAVKYKAEITDDMIVKLNSVDRPEDTDDIRTVAGYAAMCYIKAVSAPGISKQTVTEYASKEIRYMYDNVVRHWVLLWLLINMEKRYENPKALFNDLSEMIREGCNSPVIYMEFCLLIKHNIEFMHEWHESMIRPLAWGVRNDLFNQDMALAYTFHVSRVKEYNYMIYSSLDILYDKFGLDEILNAVCKMLIRAGKASPAYLKWYERGIDKKLRITGIYEGYMQSIPNGTEHIVPNQVMRYFMYDNRLPEREKQILYASAVLDKENNAQIYKAYNVMINNFAREQLEAGHINDMLAVIYGDTLNPASVDETVAVALPEIMFVHRIVCDRADMEYVCVAHEEFAGEQTVPFINGTAYIDIYSDNYCIVLVDGEGNRHIGQDYYTMEKVLPLDYYAEKCYETAPENEKLLKYMYCKCEKDFQVNAGVIRIRQRARRKLKLRSAYRKKNLSTLMQYYYDHAEGEYLDELLEMEDFGEPDKATRQKWIEILIVRGLGRQAAEAVYKYGYDGIEERYLVKLCDEAIDANTDEECDKALLGMAYYIFFKGKYSRNIIEYLAKHYVGSSDSMYEIWKVANGFGIDKNIIEEKLLTQLLFTEGDTRHGLELVESYIENGGDKNLKKGYVSYLSYRYLLYDDKISAAIWEWIENNILTEYNIVCTLAVLKKLSMEDKLVKKEVEFCDVKVSQMIQKGIIFPFFLDFAKHFKLPYGLENKVIIMCVGSPGLNVHIRYKVQNSSMICAEMTEVFAGAYIREAVVFKNEEITYECYTEKNSRKVLLSAGKAPYSNVRSDEISRYVMINKMIEHYDNRNIDELYSCMETYVKLDEASHNLFEIL